MNYMEMKQLTRRQLFTIKKRENLEKKVRKFWEETGNVDLVTEYIIAILLRNALVVSDFSLPCQELVRELLFHAEPSEMLKKFCPFLKDYVEEHEWLTVIKRLFKTETNYYKATKKVRIYESYLKNKGTAEITEKYDSYTLVSYFEDEDGKKHTWKLRDADPRNSLEEAKRILSILTKMTIFKKGNIRQFAKFLDCECHGTTTLYSSRAPKKQEEKQVAFESEEIKAVSEGETDLLNGFDLQLLNKDQLITLIKSLLKEAEAIMHEAELGDISEEDFEMLPYNNLISQKTNLNDRIAPETTDKALKTTKSTCSKDENERTLVAAGTMPEALVEKPSEVKTAPKKYYKKQERALMKRFGKI
ncbi:hypothetical protein [Enterococcus sp. DIV0756]|uniref:hypothetical protein n=1 Tax=Enterococcus sp. DIV0756 TaxID=2774636 RepID=UPI003F23DB67